ncbi:MAG: hypothetical protein U5L09_19875 [Bacteroidales bacterium]|nr:hypothetical protein [Bacteroidales bacterium]
MATALTRERVSRPPGRCCCSDGSSYGVAEIDGHWWSATEISEAPKRGADSEMDALLQPCWPLPRPRQRRGASVCVASRTDIDHLTIIGNPVAGGIKKKFLI